MKYDWLLISQKLHSIAQAGLTYSDNPYDINRYEQLQQISAEILHEFTGIEMDRIVGMLNFEKGYVTPKVDVRGVIFRDNKILMVKEKVDGLWSIPGGWADIGLSPFEVAVKEVWEESGIEAKALRLLAVFDKRMHDHPPDFFSIYKMFILCSETGGHLKGSIETDDAGFFSIKDIPPLSQTRITKEQLEILFRYNDHPEKETMCD